MADNETRHSGAAPTGKPHRDASDGDAELATRLESLSAGLRQHRVTDAPSGGIGGKDSSGYARAVKIGSEFIAGIVVGTGLGWVIDQGLGTRPWGMIIFLMLGFAAGVLNVMRAEGMVGQAGIRRPDVPGDKIDEDDRRAGP